VHGNNIVHRDIKPENILMSPAGVFKICDFGVSRLFSSDRYLELSTGIGTIWYMAPEMLMDSNNYDTTVDIWSASTYGKRTRPCRKPPAYSEFDTILLLPRKRNFVHGIRQPISVGHWRNYCQTIVRNCQNTELPRCRKSSISICANTVFGRK